MSSLGALLGATLAACCALACDSPSAPERPDLPPRPRALEGLPARASDTREPPPPAVLALPRAAECGARDASGKSIAEGDLAPDAELMVLQGQSCQLLYPAGALVTLHGPARVLAAPHGEPALLVREGALELDLAPSALTPDSGFWLATPGFSLELVQGARLALQVHAGGASHLYVVSGQARVQPAGVDERVRSVRAGQGLAISARGESAESTARLERLDQALTWVRARSATAGDAPAARDALVKRVEEALALALRDQRRTEELTRAHAQHATPGDPRAMEIQGELSRHVGQAEARRRLLLAWVAVLESWLVGAGTQAVEGRALAERARGLAGR